MKIIVTKHKSGATTFASEGIEVVVNKEAPTSVDEFEVSESEAKDVFENPKKYKVTKAKGETVLKKQ